MSNFLWPAAHKASLSFTISWSLLKFTSMESVMLSSRLILCRPLLLLPSIFPRIRVFSNESALRIKWPKYWSFSFSISPSNKYSRLISFRIDCFDLLAVQETLKSLPQTKLSKDSWAFKFFICHKQLLLCFSFWLRSLIIWQTTLVLNSSLRITLKWSLMDCCF